MWTVEEVRVALVRTADARNDEERAARMVEILRDTRPCRVAIGPADAMCRACGLVWPPHGERPPCPRVSGSG